MYTETHHLPPPPTLLYNSLNAPHSQSRSSPHSHRSSSHPSTKEPFVALAIPSITVSDRGILYGDAQSTSTRSFTPLKAVGDGTFGTVWLCDWHGPLPPNTPLSDMQSGAGARAEYANKRLVAVKRMKKKWEGGWDECKRLKELEALRAIPMHPNIIPLYDSFLLPETKELYFVFEPMEGHLFQLIKARKSRPLAGGLVASIFRQIVHGLHHVHAWGYFHRDMKPENVLVTTTGLHDYPNLSPLAPPNAPPEKDVVVIIKLADFGLARETKSRPPYTEYVSTRWYRAPEVLLKSRDYSNPVDMWALGTIMAELANLRPLFPGKGEPDQVAKIIEVLGDPCDDYGKDARGKSIGGGKWSKGIKLASSVGLVFEKVRPMDMTMLFDRNVPPKLIECIADLLKYDPAERLTSLQCMQHAYLLEADARMRPPTLTVSTSSERILPAGSLPAPSPRSHPASHPHQSHSQYASHIPDASSSHRQAFFPPGEHSIEPQYAHARRPSDNMQPYPPQLQHSTTVSSVSSYQSVSSPQGQDWDTEMHEDYIVSGQPMDIMTSPMAQEYPSRPPLEPEPMQETPSTGAHDVSAPGPKFSKLASLPFKKQHKWSGLGGMFGHNDKAQHGGLPPVDEMHVASSSSTPSLKRTQSSSTTDSRSLPEVQQHAPIEPPPPPKDPKKVKKEAERMAREAEKQRRAQAEKSHREQARAVMEKRNQVLMQTHTRGELEWKWQNHGTLVHQPDVYRTNALERDKGKSAHGPPNGGAGPIRQQGAAAAVGPYDWRRDERMAKVRRREYDDDHSMSSSDVQSIALSTMSFATVDSDPGPSGLRHRQSQMGMRASSTASSLRQFDEYSVSGRSSNSFSLEQQLVNDFHMRASVDGTSISDAGSPPPMHALTLSPAHSWQTLHPASDNGANGAMAQPQPSRLSIPRHPPPYGGAAHGLSPSPGMDAPKSAINPIFKVPSLPSLTPPVGRDPSPSTPSLPPFSQLEAVAKGEYPPLSPMSFTTPDDDF
ncbi:kinase-like protein [Auriscalpium vulgare]|uniref:Kinase-like protein n=1 Tax=Auriscalpium vulgare TaxID=40419 RepID=A0ACB8S9N0_9AGAM|nr:kinase-like protein [Auriscalpium vulgare]